MCFIWFLIFEKSEDEYVSGIGDEDLNGKYGICVLLEEEMLESKFLGCLCMKFLFEIEF